MIGLRQGPHGGQLHGAADRGSDRAGNGPRSRRLHGHASAVSECGRRGVEQAEIVFDKFHVLQHASAALDEVRRQEFFRAGAVMRAHGRGKRWLLAPALEDGPRVEARGARRLVCGQSAAVQSLRAARATRSALDLQDATRCAQLSLGWIQARCGGNGCRRWSDWATSSSIMSRASPPTAIIPSASASSSRSTRPSKPSSDARAACGMKTMLLLKLKWATAHPIRSARDWRAF